MPSYTFVCRCGWKSDRWICAGVKIPQTTKCPQCNRKAIRQFPAPAVIKTGNKFISTICSDDGFGEADHLRELAKRKAEQAGVSTAGKRYCPQLCPKGQPLSPFAWVSDLDEAKQKVSQLGYGSEDLGIKERPNEALDASAEQPYKVDPVAARQLVEHNPELSSMPDEELVDIMTPRI